MFDFIHTIDVRNYMLTVNLMLATHFTQSRRGATKFLESCGMLRNHLFRKFHRLTGSLVPGDSIFTGNERSIFEMLSRLRVNTGQGSPLVKHMTV